MKQKCKWLCALLLVATMGWLGCVGASAQNGESETYTAVPYTQSTNNTNSTNSTNSTTSETPVVSYGLHVLAGREEAVFTGLCGNEITFTAKDICRVMNLSSFSYITIKSLP